MEISTLASYLTALASITVYHSLIIPDSDSQMRRFFNREVGSNLGRQPFCPKHYLSAKPALTGQDSGV